MPNRSRVLAAGLGAVLAVAGAIAAQAGAITYVEFGGGIAPVANSQNTSSLSCPDGEKVIGGGTVASAGFGIENLVGTRPDDGDDQGNDEFDDAWAGVVDFGNEVSTAALETSVICQGGEVASKLRYREKQAGVEANSRKTKAVGCPRDYKVTGGGASGEGTFDTTELEMTRPIDGGRAWEGRVRNFSADPHSMTVYAICATGRFARNLVYREKSGSVPAGTVKDVTTKCPPGSNVTGGGALLQQASPKLGSSWFSSVFSWASHVDAVGEDATFKTYAVCKT